jgi:hypothetical protein
MSHHSCLLGGFLHAAEDETVGRAAAEDSSAKQSAERRLKECMSVSGETLAFYRVIRNVADVFHKRWQKPYIYVTW